MKSHLAKTSVIDCSLSVFSPTTITSKGIIPRLPQSSELSEPSWIPSSDIAIWNLPVKAVNRAILSAKSLADTPK